MNDKFAFDNETGRMAFTAVGCMERHNHPRESEFKRDEFDKVAGVREYREDNRLIAKAKELQAKGYKIGSMSIEEFVEAHAPVLAQAA